MSVDERIKEVKERLANLSLFKDGNEYAKLCKELKELKKKSREV